MNRNLKLLFATIYIVCIGILLFVVFSYLDLKDLSSYAYIKSNSEILLAYKKDNLMLFVSVFFIFSIFWILFLGFATPIAIISGFIFGKWYGTLISLFSFTIGCTLLYWLASHYIKEFISNFLSKKVEKYKNVFNKNEFLYYMIFRITGGAGLPFAIQNVLPVIFNMKIKNYFYSSLIGLVPGIFIINCLGSGIENIIKNNEKFNYSNIISDPGIYLPLIGFVIIVLFSVLIKKKLFKS